MRSPIFVRPLSDEEQHQIQAGLHSKDAFVLRRCQILMASTRGERAIVIAKHLGCDDQTVRNVIYGFNTDGLAVLQMKSSRPHQCHEAIADEDLPRLQALLHRGPRDYGKDTSLWSLPLLAQVCFEQRLTRELVSGETIRQAIRRLGLNWKRVKHRINSPDPLYQQKKRMRPIDHLGLSAAWLGHWFPRRGLVESLRSASCLCLAKSRPSRALR